jgi:hypothetical protein
MQQSQPRLAQHKDMLTLNVSRALTFSASTSAITLSKLFRIFMASWGSMRPSLMRSSTVSMSASPILVNQVSTPPR